MSISFSNPETGVAEAATDYWSPCCEGHGLYAHFTCFADGTEVPSGFQCTNCGADFDASEKEEFES